MSKSKGKSKHFHEDSIISTISNNTTALDAHIAKIENNDIEFKKLAKPKDQLKLDHECLNEKIVRHLKANNPMPAITIIRFSFREKCFRPYPQLDQLIVDFKKEGNYIHVDSEEAKIQFERIRTDPVVRDRYIKMRSMDVDESSSDGEGDDDEEKSTKKKKKKKKVVKVVVKKSLKRFDLNSRSTQTRSYNYEDAETMTVSPLLLDFCEQATADAIHDAYVEDFKMKEQKQSNTKLKFAKPERTILQNQILDDLAPKLCKAAMLIERILSQNSNADIIEDFKYWEDKADDYRTEGALLPLWKMSFKETRKLTVCSIAWLPFYPDSFCVGYGSYDLIKTNGLIACFTLKNAAYPFQTFKTDFGCMSVDVNPQYSYLIATGFYDGSIAVYSLIAKNQNQVNNKGSSKHAFISEEGNHRDPVWQVKWDKRDLYGYLGLYSVSSDGRIVRWSLKKNELNPMDVINLKLVDIEYNDFLGNLVRGSSCCFESNEQNELLFLVGTEEGKVHCCSKGYHNSLIDTYDAHNMSVYAVHWNKFYSKYYLTCSADWTVKIWELNLKEPLEVFDLGGPVADCGWSPYSSTVFGAVTADGRVCVWDLNIDKTLPLTDQRISSDMRERKFTRLEFNPTMPIIIIGDDKGNVICLKLSPNLRRKPKELIRKDVIIFEGEISKLERVFSTFVDPDADYTKTFKMYQIPRPREQHQKKMDGMQTSEFGDKRKFTNQNDGENDNDGEEKNVES